MSKVTPCVELKTVAYQYKFRDVWLVSDAPKVMRKDDYELRELVTRQNAEEVIAAERLKLEATARVGLQLSEKIDALEADNKRLREALEAMLIPFEDSNCRHDHHGYCQEHFLEEDCCVAKARAALGEVKP